MGLKNVDGVERLLNNMERYFEVTKQSNLYNQYMEYKNNQQVLHNISKEFMDVQGIETNEYANQSDKFYIVPTEKDLEKFGKSLCKSIGEGCVLWLKNYIGTDTSWFVKDMKKYNKLNEQLGIDNNSRELKLD